MAIHRYATPGMREVESRSTTYSQARQGTGNKSLAPTGQDYSFCGQAKNGPTYYVWQPFLRFQPDAAPAGSLVVTAQLCFSVAGAFGAVSRHTEIREYDYLATQGALTTADFRPGTELAELPLMGDLQNTTASMEGYRPLSTSTPELREKIRSGATYLPLVMHTSRQRNGHAPTGNEFAYWLNHNAADIYKPYLTFTTIRESSLLRVGAASAQLSDGTSVFIDDSFSLRHSVDNDADTEIADLPTGDGVHEFDDDVPAWQAVALAVDDYDNIYVVGKAGSADNSILLYAYFKGAGYTWTQWFSPKHLAMPSYTANTPINNVSVAWHNTSQRGHLVVLYSHEMGRDSEGQVGYAVLDIAGMLTGGTYVSDAGTEPAFLGLVNPTATGNISTNDTGTGLQVVSIGNGTQGVGFSFDGTTTPNIGQRRFAWGTYTVSSSGKLTQQQSYAGGSFTDYELEPETTSKLVAVGGQAAAFLIGRTLWIKSMTGAQLAGMIVNLPDDLFETPAGDLIYDPASGALWLYFIAESSGELILARAPVSLEDYSVGSAVGVAVVGEAGDTVLGIRTPVGRVNERHVRVDVSVQESGGSESVVTIDDTFNVPPAPPTLVTRDTFNAASSTNFQWTFSDVNTDDDQTAYQLRIYDVETETLTYDTGKVNSSARTHLLPGSTLENTKAYQWEVRVWDLADAVSEYSPRGQFETVSDAITEIITPSVDNPPDAVSAQYTVQWDTPDFEQAQFRLRLIDTATEDTVFDTNWVVSTEKEYTLTGLQDGVTYRVEVTARNNVDVESTPGTRLITPDYAEPMTPVVHLTAVPEGGYVLVIVENPEPTGEEPEPAYNDIYRAPAGSNEWVRIGAAGPNGEYRDYAVRSGQDYDYKAYAVV